MSANGKTDNLGDMGGEELLDEVFDDHLRTTPQGEAMWAELARRLREWERGRLSCNICGHPIAEHVNIVWRASGCQESDCKCEFSPALPSGEQTQGEPLKETCDQCSRPLAQVGMAIGNTCIDCVNAAPPAENGGAK